MPHECVYTGRRTKIGRQCTYRGKAKYLGGVGIKITGRSARKFKPNLHTVRAVIDGTVRRVKASAKAIRMGLVVKPLKRNWKPAQVEQDATVATQTDAGNTENPVQDQ